MRRLSIRELFAAFAVSAGLVALADCSESAAPAGPAGPPQAANRVEQGTPIANARGAT